MGMSDKEKDHLWIPEEEVIRLPHEPTGREKPRDVIPSEHGKKLSAGLQEIVQMQQAVQQCSSLDPEMMVFKVHLPEGQKMDNRQRTQFLQDNGMSIRAVRNQREAIVSTTKLAFEALRRKVERYTQESRFQGFQYIDDFQPFTAAEKQTFSVRRRIQDAPGTELDIQVMLMPNLTSTQYEEAVAKIGTAIDTRLGRKVEDIYYLTDGTPVIRTLVVTQDLQVLASDNAVYRIEETAFFSSIRLTDNSTSPVAPKIDLGLLNDLPLVVVLDTGVDFPKPLDKLVVHRWRPVGLGHIDPEHGTLVASRVAFGYGLSNRDEPIRPRARIIDAAIIDGKVPQNIMVKRLQQAVSQLASLASVFNLSANAEAPIDGDEMSVIGYELDCLMVKYDVVIVVSAGNHHVWKTSLTLSEVIDDDDSVVAMPADSMLSVVSGAVVGVGNARSISKENEIAPYSRRGPGLAGSYKPDIVAYSANAYLQGQDTHYVVDPFSLAIQPSGKISPALGTSFSAPIVAGDLAVIASEMHIQHMLLAKTLLFHGAKPLWDPEGMGEEEKELAARLYGAGLADVKRSLYSSPSRVTFVRVGELDRLTKERVRFYMPEVLAAKPGRNTARVSVTCLSHPPFDRTKGAQYLGAYVSASLYKVNSNGQIAAGNPSTRVGRQKWDVCHRFDRLYSQFSAGDWQVWLQLHTRWDVPDNLRIPYALAITIEDLSNELDLYNEIMIESRGRFRPMSQLVTQVEVRT